MDLACKTNIATVYYLDREGKFPRSVEITCVLQENQKCKVETNQCKQVFWVHERESEIHHFCACVKPEETKVEFGPPSGQLAPCQITIVQKKSAGGLIMEPKCVGHCPADDEHCVPHEGEMDQYARALPDGRVEVGWKREFYCHCKRK